VIGRPEQLGERDAAVPGIETRRPAVAGGNRDGPSAEITILVVDDEDDIRDLVATALRFGGSQSSRPTPAGRQWVVPAPPTPV
jgi:hypothetical protein